MGRSILAATFFAVFGLVIALMKENEHERTQGIVEKRIEKHTLDPLSGFSLETESIQ